MRIWLGAVLIFLWGCERAPEPMAPKPVVEEEPLLPLAPDNIQASIADFELGADLVFKNETQITNIEFHPSAPIIYAIGLDGTIYAHDIVSGNSSMIFDLRQTKIVILLTDFTFHPDFMLNGKVYACYVAFGTEGNHVSVVSEFTVTGNPADFVQVDMTSEKELMQWDQITTDSHTVNDLNFGPDSYLYISTGDGGCCADTLNSAQSLKTLLGKLLRIDVNRSTDSTNYVVPNDNPFVENNDARKEIFAYGMRNPYRFFFDIENNIYLFDVGAGAREEINFISNNDLMGKNFGWTIFEGTYCHNKDPRCFDARSDISFPIFELKHPPFFAIIGGAMSTGTEIPQLQNQILFGDFNLGTVMSLSYNPLSGEVSNFIDVTSAVTTENTQVGQPNLVSINSDSEGNIYLVYLMGEVYKLVSTN